ESTTWSGREPATSSAKLEENAATATYRLAVPVAPDPRARTMNLWV
ncbi:MAG: hypothetical protein QOE01_765, partial [Actinomycetota bacterium]|nr:hypothetical protein [Actinomycetota bacterium]